MGEVEPGGPLAERRLGFSLLPIDWRRRLREEDLELLPEGPRLMLAAPWWRAGMAADKETPTDLDT